MTINWQEELHPRAGKGNPKGGQFVSKGGARPAAKQRAAAIQKQQPNPLGFSKDEVDAIGEYINDSTLINDWYRKGRTGALYDHPSPKRKVKVSAEEIAKIDKTIDDLNAALQKSVTTTDVAVFRGISECAVSRQMIKEAKAGTLVGKKVELSGFASTTTSQDVADEFVSSYNSPVVMHITLPKDTHAIDMEPFAMNFAKQKELLLGEGSLEITGIDDSGGILLVKGTYTEKKRQAKEESLARRADVQVQGKPGYESLPSQSTIIYVPDVQKNVEILINPDGVEGFGKYLRVMQDKKKNLYVWDASDAIHDEIQYGLKIPGSKGLDRDEWNVVHGKLTSDAGNDIQSWIDAGQENAKQAEGLASRDTKKAYEQIKNLQARPSKEDQAKTLAALQPILDKLDYPASDIQIMGWAPKGDPGLLGRFVPAKGQILLYQNCLRYGKKMREGVIAHEVMHAKRDAVSRSHNPEVKEIMAPFNTKEAKAKRASMEAYSTVTTPYSHQFWFGADLVRSDRTLFKKIEVAHASDLAENETLAEMAAQHIRKGEHPKGASGLWVNYYNAINRAYKIITPTRGPRGVL